MIKKSSIILLIILIFIVSCTKVQFVCPDGSLVSSKSDCKLTEDKPAVPEPEIKEEKPVEEPKEEPKQEIKEEKPEEKKLGFPLEVEMLVGDELLIDGKLIKLASFDSVSETGFIIDNVKRTVYSTGVPEVINGLEVTTKRFIHSPEGIEKTKIVVAFARFQLGQDEYLLHVGESTKVNGIKLTVKKINPSNSYIEIGTNEEGPFMDINLKLGGTKKLGSLKITSVKVFGKAKPYESYAILKIVAAN